MNNRWYILGAGAIGNLWACNLVSLGFQVTLLLRNNERLTQFQNQGGIQLKHTDNVYFYPTDAELSNANTPIEQLLITTKAIDTEQAFNQIKHRLQHDCRVIVLQNGMGSQQWVSEQLPDNQVIWASTTDGAWLSSPFCLTHAGKGVTRLGSDDNTDISWLTSLHGGLLDVEIDHDIETTLWRKLAINCAINPLTAYYQCRNGELLENLEYLYEMKLICEEVERVAEAEGIPLFNTPLIEHAKHVAELTANNFSSMMQDHRNQRTTEIDNITGYLCLLAKKHQIETPANKKYLEKIKRGETLQEK